MTKDIFNKISVQIKEKLTDETDLNYFTGPTNMRLEDLYKLFKERLLSELEVKKGVCEKNTSIGIVYCDKWEIKDKTK